MSLKDKVTKPGPEPLRVCVYGTAGVGKTTLAAGAPRPFFVSAEKGTGHLDVEGSACSSWGEIAAVLSEARKDPSGYETLVVDTLDAVEAMMIQDFLDRDHVETIADAAGGYGRGTNALVSKWRVFLAELDQLPMHVVLLAHEQVKTFADPVAGNYDRYTLKLQDRVAATTIEWCQAVLFAQYETAVVRKKEFKGGRGVFSGRLLHTTKGLGYEAKNRFSLAPTMPLEAQSVWPALLGRRTTADEVIELAKKIPDEEKREAAIAFIYSSKGDLAALRQAESRVRELLEVA